MPTQDPFKHCPHRRGCPYYGNAKHRYPAGPEGCICGHNMSNCQPNHVSFLYKIDEILRTVRELSQLAKKD